MMLTDTMFVTPAFVVSTSLPVELSAHRDDLPEIVPMYVLPDDEEMLNELINRMGDKYGTIEIARVEFIEDWSDLDNLLPAADPVTE